MNILPDFSKFLDFSSLFVALIGLLFASWQPVFHQLLSTPRPPIYKNRKVYIHSISSALFSQSIPLMIFIFAYLISLSGIALKVAHGSELTIDPYAIEPALTLFALTYLLAIFLFGLTFVASFRLFLAWWRAGEDRGTNPRVTLLR